MTDGPGYHNRQGPICSKIRSLLIALTNERSKYDEIAPKIEYWIEYVLREHFVTVDELVRGVSGVGWGGGGSYASVARFFKEFYDAPHRSEQARSFVAQLCPYVLRWFAIASAEDIWPHFRPSISGNGAPGFISAASFVGHLIDRGLLSHELVRRHLTKSLTNHHDNDDRTNSPGAIRARAIYELFTAAGNTLLRGFLDPDDIQACFDILYTWSQRKVKFDVAKLKELRGIHAAWKRQKGEQKDHRGTEEHRDGAGEDMIVARVSAEVKTPVAFAPQDIPEITLGIEIPPFISPDIESSSVFTDGDSSPDTFIDIPSGAVSPTLSISTVSDLTPTELGEEIEPGEKQMTTHHDIFYFEDGNVEIACGDTIFRVHSTIISFASSRLREILSQAALLNAPTPVGRPRISISDSAEDFGVLLKMIYTPGFPARHKVPEFGLFASLLRMTTKYGFSDVRDQLVDDLKGAYPTKWEDYRGAKVLGENVFGAPLPHPNAVLNLFEAQNIRFAMPFAAYRASLGGFGGLMSDKPGTVLSRRSLASTIQGMHTLSAVVTSVARIIAYGRCLRVCPDKGCTLNVGVNPIEKRIEALGKVHVAMVDEREGELLDPPSLKHLLCAPCANYVEACHTKSGPILWRDLPLWFNVSRGWDGL